MLTHTSYQPIRQYADSVVISKEIIDAKVKAHGAYYYLLTQLVSD